MCYVTATELKKSLSHYMDVALREDVIVTKNGKVLIKLVNPQTTARDDLFSFYKTLPPIPRDERSDKEIIGEAILEKCGC